MQNGMFGRFQGSVMIRTLSGLLGHGLGWRVILGSFSNEQVSLMFLYWERVPLGVKQVTMIPEAPTLLFSVWVGWVGILALESHRTMPFISCGALRKPPRLSKLRVSSSVKRGQKMVHT